jgi:hypothetical protein
VGEAVDAASVLHQQLVPDGLVIADGQLAWMGELRARQQVQDLRSDARRNLFAIAQLLANWASWTSLASAPGWDTLREATGLGRATVARWLAWLRHQGLLVIVEPGSTPQFRPMALADLDGNRRAVYALTVPMAVADCASHDSVAGADEPSLTSVDATSTGSETPTASRRDASSGNQWLSQLTRARANVQASPGLLWITALETQRDRLLAAEEMRGRSGVFRRRSARLWRHVLRPWFEAGWTASDIFWHIDHLPDHLGGGQHPYAFRDDARDLRNPIGWVLFRLRLWLVDGEISRSRSQRLHAEQAQRRAQEQARAHRQAVQRLHAADGQRAHVWADRIRAQWADKRRHELAAAAEHLDRPGE